MREILFRGKRIDNCEWLYGNLIEWDYGLFSIIPMKVYTLTPMKAHTFEINPKTLGQYTGLKDKNGVKIFEGDIIDFSYNILIYRSRNFNIRIEKGIIEFISGSIWIKTSEFKCFRLYEVNEDDLEVIGNIYDNPKLLESEEK